MSSIVDRVSKRKRSKVRYSAEEEESSNSIQALYGIDAAALEKIRAAYEGRVPTESAPADGAPSKTELYAMVGDPKYKTDPAYRAKVEKMFQASFGV